MASVAVSNISNITRYVAGGKGTGLNVGNQPMACFRIASGQLSGDTAVLQDPNVPAIVSVAGPVINSIGTNLTGVTAVTVTLAGVTGSAITVTNGAFDVWLLGPLPTA